MKQNLRRHLFVSLAFLGTLTVSAAHASESFLRPLVGHHNLKGDAGCQDLVIGYNSGSYTAVANGNYYILGQLDSEASVKSMRVSGNTYQMSFTFWKGFAWTDGVHSETKITTSADGRSIESLSAVYSEPRNKADFSPRVLRKLSCVRK